MRLLCWSNGGICAILTFHPKFPEYVRFFMNEKEVAELRRRLRPDKSNISRIRGCYVNERREIISQFNDSLTLMPAEDGEKYLSIFRKVLTGALGRNLLELTFQTQQVVDGEEHRLLMTLRDSALEDENAVQAFFSRTIQSLELEGNCLILLTYNTYDVCYKGRDDVVQEDESAEQFRYILCAVCPVKETKPFLHYNNRESRFHIQGAGQAVSAPELGFLFPAFDDRATNIYNALLYTHDVSDSHEGFVDALFKTPVPMPAAVQRETFQTLLGDTLEEECSYDVVQGVQDRLTQLIEVHKESHEPAPLAVSKNGLRAMLSASGVSDGHLEQFDEQFDARFGANAEVNPLNLVDTKRLEVKLPDVVIQVNPARSELLQTRMVDGAKCIVIRVSDEVEVNGVTIQIAADDAGATS